MRQHEPDAALTPLLPGPLPPQSLYGHYLLPNGRLAHFVLGDTVRKGHKV